MKNSNLTKEQIDYVVRQLEGGDTNLKWAARWKSARAALYRRKRKCAGSGVAALRRPRRLEEEENRFGRIFCYEDLGEES